MVNESHEPHSSQPENNSLADELLHGALVSNTLGRFKKALAAVDRGSSSDVEEHLSKAIKSGQLAILNPFSPKLTAGENARRKTLVNMCYYAEANGTIGENPMPDALFEELARLDRKAWSQVEEDS